MALQFIMTDPTSTCAVCKRTVRPGGKSPEVCDGCFDCHMLCTNCARWYYCTNWQQRIYRDFCGGCYHRMKEPSAAESRSGAHGAVQGRLPRLCPQGRCTVQGVRL